MTDVFGVRVTRRLAMVLLVGYDLVAVLASIQIALLLRFESWNSALLHHHLRSLPFVVLTYLLCFVLFRLYRFRWRFAGVDMFWAVLRSTALATAGSAGWQWLTDGTVMSPTVIVLIFLLTTTLIGVQRILLRIASERFEHLPAPNTPDHQWDNVPKRTVILADGQSTLEVLNALEKDFARRSEVIGILDDDRRHHGSFVHGCQILGGLSMLHELLQQAVPDEVIIALPDASHEQIREYVLACCRQKVAVRVVPMISRLLSPPSGMRGRRGMYDVTVEDLLHRQPVETALVEEGEYLIGTRILVTGAGGSIGSELCRQIVRLTPCQLILLGHGENSIHSIEQELKRQDPELAAEIIPVICDVRDNERLRAVFGQYRPQIVFHAAAHKHVPLMEENVAEAISNNIGGTRNVVRAATEFGIERMVLISSDKAVNPSSVMGASKFLCEELMLAEASRSTTCFITVRFGNVLGSRGSVLPIFQEQIRLGGPVTVTHPEMRRFFMTIPEAVSLVLKAGASERSGSLFVLDMGQPVRILDLAENIIRLSGLVPHRDIQIQFTGLRHGEKLDEELLTETEQQVVRCDDHLFVVDRPQYLDPMELDHRISDLLAAARHYRDVDVRARLCTLVPSLGEVTMIPPSIDLQHLRC